MDDWHFYPAQSLNWFDFVFVEVHEFEVGKFHLHDFFDEPWFIIFGWIKA